MWGLLGSGTTPPEFLPLRVVLYPSIRVLDFLTSAGSSELSTSGSQDFLSFLSASPMFGAVTLALSIKKKKKKKALKK